MSLTIPRRMLEAVQNGSSVTDDAFVRVIHDSLHDAFHIVEHLAAQLFAYAPEVDLAVHAPARMDDGPRGQLLRLMASNALRGAVERRFNVRLAFQNCHKVAAFRPEAVDGPAWKAFTSIEAQVLNQAPDSLDC
ncbi:MAG: SCO5389 family protein [Patescibacteria group bacterium]|nr:MAG: SCO5389 family protein [Patescibacteria group bacterium]